MSRVNVAIRAHRLFDGINLHNGPAQVLVEDGIIRSIDYTGSNAPLGYACEDYGDATIVPGLIDAHSHLSFDAGRKLDEQMSTDTEDTIISRIRYNSEQALKVGITTVRDLGDRDHLTVRVRDEFNRSKAPTTEILTSGPPLTSPGGHCCILGGQVCGVEQITSAVQERVQAGVDVIKVMATGGMSTNPSQVQFDGRELLCAAQAAHSNHLQIVAHAHSTRGIRAAIDSGVDGIEHCSFMTSSGIQRDNQAIDDLAESGIFVGCTVARPRDDMDQSVRDTLEPYWENNAYMHRRGVKLVCCTDAGINPFKPHDVLPSDVGYFASQLGTTLEALRSVTSLAAESCRVGHRKGRIASGYEADILIVRGNPTVRISDLQQIKAVYRLGLLCSKVYAN